MIRTVGLATWSRRGAWSAALVAALVPAVSARAEEVKLRHVGYDVRAKAFSSELPHGVPFVVDVRVPRETTATRLRFWKSDGTCTKEPDAPTSVEGLPQDPPKDGDYRDFSVAMPRLEPNDNYCFVAVTARPWTDDDKAAVAEALSQALTTYVAGGSLGPVRFASLLKEKLGKRADYVVAGGSESIVTVLSREGLDGTKPVGAAYKKVQKAWTDASDASRSARDAIVALRKKPSIQAAAVPDPQLRKVLVDREALAEAAAEAGKDLEVLVEREPVAIPASIASAGKLAKELATEAGGAAAKAHCSEDVASKLPVCLQINAAFTDATQLSDSTEALAATAKGYAATRKVLDVAIAERAQTIEVSVAPRPWRSESPTFTERSIWYVSGDVGGVVPFYGDFSLYLGINVNFRAIDKDKPLDKGLNGLEIDKRLSAIVGLTLAEMKTPSGDARGVLDGKGVMMGLGLRLTDYVRLGGGAMLLRQKDANPLSARTSVQATPFVSASIDIDVWGTLKTTLGKGP